MGDVGALFSPSGGFGFVGDSKELFGEWGDGASSFPNLSKTAPFTFETLLISEIACSTPAWSGMKFKV